MTCPGLELGSLAIASAYAELWSEPLSSLLACGNLADIVLIILFTFDYA